MMKCITTRMNAFRTYHVYLFFFCYYFLCIILFVSSYSSRCMGGNDERVINIYRRKPTA